MTDVQPWYEDVTLPALLRAARRTYGEAMRQALAEAGCGDIPGNGIYVIGGIARTGSPLGELIKALGVSKQAAGQLVDTLVVRGYLERAPDPEDRRRMTVTLTERGWLAASTSRAAGERVEAELEDRVGPDQVRQARATLATLIDIGHRHDHDGVQE